MHTYIHLQRRSSFVVRTLNPLKLFHWWEQTPFSMENLLQMLTQKLNAPHTKSNHKWFWFKNRFSTLIRQYCCSINSYSNYYFAKKGSTETVNSKRNILPSQEQMLRNKSNINHFNPSNTLCHLNAKQNLPMIWFSIWYAFRIVWHKLCQIHNKFDDTTTL